MPNVYQPGLVQIRPQYTTEIESGDTPENVLWFQSATHSTPTIGNLTTIAETFDTNWSEVFSSYGGTHGSYLGCIVTDWSSASGLQWNSVGIFEPEAGGQGNNQPPQVAILVSYQIQLRWRGGHFRTYLPYVGAANITGSQLDQITTALQTTLQTNINTMITAMKDSGVLGGQTLVMYKDKTKPTEATLYQVSTFAVNLVLATQRRRIRKVSRK